MISEYSLWGISTPSGDDRIKWLILATRKAVAARFAETASDNWLSLLKSLDELIEQEYPAA